MPAQCVAPDAYRHDGLYLRLPFLGGGLEYASIFGDGPSASASISGIGLGNMLAIGGTPWDGVVLAGAYRFAVVLPNTFHGAPAGAEGDAAALLAQLGVLADWYPMPDEGWHVGGMGGLALMNINAEASEGDMSGSSLGASIFGGYDWWIGPQWSIGMMLAASATMSATMRQSDRVETGYDFAALTIGVEGSILLH